MVGHAGCTAVIVHADMTLTRSKVKDKVTGLLNFRKLAKPRMLTAMTVSPLAGFLVPRWRPSAILNLLCVCSDSPRMAFGGLYGRAKFSGNRCNSFDNMHVFFCFASLT